MSYMGLNDFIWLKRGAYVPPNVTGTAEELGVSANAEGLNLPANLVNSVPPAPPPGWYPDDPALLASAGIGPNGGHIRERGFAPEGCCSPYLTVDYSDSAAGGYSGNSVTSGEMINLDPNWMHSTDSRDWLLNLPAPRSEYSQSDFSASGDAGLWGVKGLGLGALAGTREATTNEKIDLTREAYSLINSSKSLPENQLEALDYRVGRALTKLDQLSAFEGSGPIAYDRWDNSQTIRTNLQQARQNIRIRQGKRGEGARTQGAVRDTSVAESFAKNINVFGASGADFRRDVQVQASKIASKTGQVVDNTTDMLSSNWTKIGAIVVGAVGIGYFLNAVKR